MNRAAARILLPSAYATCIALIVAAANLGSLGRLTGFIHTIPGADKGCHFLLVGGLALALNHATRCQTVPIFQRRILVGTLVCLPLSIVEEFTQLLIPSRTFDLADLSMNVLGVLIVGPLARHLNPAPPAAW